MMGFQSTMKHPQPPRAMPHPVVVKHDPMMYARHLSGLSKWRQGQDGGPYGTREWDNQASSAEVGGSSRTIRVCPPRTPCKLSHVTTALITSEVRKQHIAQTRTPRDPEVSPFGEVKKILEAEETQVSSTVINEVSPSAGPLVQSTIPSHPQAQAPRDQSRRTFRKERRLEIEREKAK